jgi:hypothetical protein
MNIAVQYTVVNDTLEIRVAGTGANFDLTVSCLKPTFSVGFVGAMLTVEPEYQREREACIKAATKMFKDKYIGGE